MSTWVPRLHANGILSLPDPVREGPPPEVNGHPEKKALFPLPIPASLLKIPPAPPWVLHGYLARGATTLLTALWKSGKTTWLVHLLKAMAESESFCGRELTPGHVLYVTEEGEGRWARRVQAMSIADHVHFLVRPFQAKPDWAGWKAFILHLADLRTTRHVDLIVMDTLVDLWPVRDENDASQVQSALMPLRKLVEDEKTALLLSHHNRKGDGTEATASRGSGALTSFVDTIIEMRRYEAAKDDDCRRVLKAYGRDEETPAEVVVELNDDGYRAHGSRNQTAVMDIAVVLPRLLPCEPPGMTQEEVKEAWTEDEKPRRQRLLDALREGARSNKWHCEGTGGRGNPFRYWVDPPLS